MEGTDYEKLLADFLEARGQSHCPKCNKKMGKEDFSWKTDSTEWGTDFVEVEVVCSYCQTAVGWGTSWGLVVNFEEAVEALDENTNFVPGEPY